MTKKNGIELQTKRGERKSYGNQADGDHLDRGSKSNKLYTCIIYTRIVREAITMRSE